MAKVKLYVVIAGRNRWRLRTDREAAQYLCEFKCARVKIILPGFDEFFLDKQMRTYRYLSLTHPSINEWIISHRFNRTNGEIPEVLPFMFSVEGDTHVYRYAGR